MIRPVITVVGLLAWAAPVRSGLVGVLTEAEEVPPQMISVVPTETQATLANPGMGWHTFHRTRHQDKHLPEWIPSTLHYARWGWSTLEPQSGEIDHAFLENVLKETREAGQSLAFRVTCCSTTPRRPYHPQWLRALGGRTIKDTTGFWSPASPSISGCPVRSSCSLRFLCRRHPTSPPGPVYDVVENLRMPEDMLPGEYRLALAVVGQTSTKPVVQLGIKERTADGWYPLSTLTIAK